MSGKTEQSKSKDAQADQVIGGAKKGETGNDPAALKAANDRAHELQTQLDATAAESAQLAEKVKELEGSNAAYKGNVTKAENARADDHAALKASLVQFKLATEKEVEAEDFNPVDAVLKALGDTLAECSSVKRSLRAQKGATTRVKGEVEALEEAAKPRPLGPVEDQPKAADLAELINSMPDRARVEIAFSNGREELAAIPPVSVPVRSFAFRRGRLTVNVPSLQIKGPVDDKGPRVLAGYVLLIDGEPMAYAPRIGGQLVLGGGQQYELKDDVILT